MVFLKILNCDKHHQIYQICGMTELFKDIVSTGDQGFEEEARITFQSLTDYMILKMSQDHHDLCKVVNQKFP